MAESAPSTSSQPVPGATEQAIAEVKNRYDRAIGEVRVQILADKKAALESGDLPCLEATWRRLAWAAGQLRLQGLVPVIVATQVGSLAIISLSTLSASALTPTAHAASLFSILISPVVSAFPSTLQIE